MPLDPGKILKAIRSDSSANRVDPEAPNSNSNVSTLIKMAQECETNQQLEPRLEGSSMLKDAQ